MSTRQISILLLENAWHTATGDAQTVLAIAADGHVWLNRLGTPDTLKLTLDDAQALVAYITANHNPTPTPAPIHRRGGRPKKVRPVEDPVGPNDEPP